MNGRPHGHSFERGPRGDPGHGDAGQSAIDLGDMQALEKIRADRKESAEKENSGDTEHSMVLLHRRFAGVKLERFNSISFEKPSDF